MCSSWFPFAHRTRCRAVEGFLKIIRETKFRCLISFFTIRFQTICSRAMLREVSEVARVMRYRTQRKLEWRVTGLTYVPRRCNLSSRSSSLTTRNAVFIFYVRQTSNVYSPAWGFYIRTATDTIFIPIAKERVNSKNLLEIYIRQNIFIGTI